MRINCHCHVLSLDCVPEGFRERFGLDFDHLLDRAFYWLVTSLLPDGSKPDEMLQLADLSILEIALRLVREMDQAGIDLAVPLTMDMHFCDRFPEPPKKSFAEQLAETEFAAQVLKEQYGRPRLLPFIAVDPRREGIVDLVQDKIPADKTRRQHFWGVKIYPPMGFLPADDILTPLYAYCEEYAIPITTHCLNGGMPGLRREDYERANPCHWEPVLEAFPNLKLNLGHNDKTGSTWQRTIEQLIERYPQVYADVAFNTEMWFMPRQYFQNIKRLLTLDDDAHRHAPHRLLYGTDWYMGRFLWTEESYLKWFLDYANRLIWCDVEFTDEEIRRFTLDNPQAFLGWSSD